MCVRVVSHPDHHAFVVSGSDGVELDLDVSEGLLQPVADRGPDVLAGATADMIDAIVGDQVEEGG